jgi:hypothetical protein
MPGKLLSQNRLITQIYHNTTAIKHDYGERRLRLFGLVQYYQVLVVDVAVPSGVGPKPA